LDEVPRSGDQTPNTRLTGVDWVSTRRRQNPRQLYFTERSLTVKQNLAKLLDPQTQQRSRCEGASQTCRKLCWLRGRNNHARTRAGGRETGGDDRRRYHVGLFSGRVPTGGYEHPSPAGTGYDAANSGGTNLGPTNKTLIARVEQDAAILHAENANLPVPVDLVTTSASSHLHRRC